MRQEALQREQEKLKAQQSTVCFGGGSGLGSHTAKKRKAEIPPAVVIGIVQPRETQTVTTVPPQPRARAECGGVAAAAAVQPMDVDEGAGVDDSMVVETLSDAVDTAPAQLPLSPAAQAALLGALEKLFNEHPVLSDNSIHNLLKRAKMFPYAFRREMKATTRRTLIAAIKDTKTYRFFRGVWIRREAGPPEQRRLRRVMLDLLEEKVHVVGVEISIQSVGEAAAAAKVAKSSLTRA